MKGFKKKLGIIQAIIQTLNEIFQKAKIGIIIYSVLTGLRDEQYD